MPYENMEKELDELLELASTEGQSEMQTALSTELVKVDEKELAQSNTHITDDYNFIRANLRSIIGNSENVLQTLIPLAAASDNARLYEVLAQHLKTLVETNRELMQVQKDLKDLKKDSNSQAFGKSGQQSQINVDKAVFVGSSSNVLEKIIEGEKVDTPSK